MVRLQRVQCLLQFTNNNLKGKYAPFCFESLTWYDVKTGKIPQQMKFIDKSAEADIRYFS